MRVPKLCPTTPASLLTIRTFATSRLASVMRALQRIRMGCIGWRCYFINEARSLPALSIQHSAFSIQQGKPLFVSQETFWSSADPGLDYGLICFYCANLHAVSIYLL